jgi:hypothetical protein
LMSDVLLLLCECGVVVRHGYRKARGKFMVERVWQEWMRKWVASLGAVAVSAGKAHGKQAKRDKEEESSGSDSDSDEEMGSGSESKRGTKRGREDQGDSKRPAKKQKTAGGEAQGWWMLESLGTGLIIVDRFRWCGRGQCERRHRWCC